MIRIQSDCDETHSFAKDANEWGTRQHRHKREVCHLEAYVEELLAQLAATVSAETRRLQTPEQIRAWLDSSGPVAISPLDVT